MAESEKMIKKRHTQHCGDRDREKERETHSVERMAPPRRKNSINIF